MDGRLAERFGEVGGKLLSSVERWGPGRSSNQHELNGVKEFERLLGHQRRTLECRFVRFREGVVDGQIDAESMDGQLTWYDAREKSAERTGRSEFRLYYTSEVTVMADSHELDFCWLLTHTHDDGFTLVLADRDSRPANALDRLLGTNLRERSAGLVRSRQMDLERVDDANGAGLDLVEADVLAALGVAVSIEASLLDRLIERFGGVYPLPRVNEFAQFTRGLATSGADPVADPDLVLHDWYTTTTSAFYAYERHVLQPVLDAELLRGDHIDVDNFFTLATRFKNSRFSRAGHTFERHLEALFDLNRIRWEHPTRPLSDHTIPDYLMPGIAEFEDPTFPDEYLTVASAKTTSKERWREVATEGLRIERKFYITLDKQLDVPNLRGMTALGIVPVIPTPIQATYGLDLATGMMSMRELLDLVRHREAKAITSGALTPRLA